LPLPRQVFLQEGGESKRQLPIQGTTRRLHLVSRPLQSTTGLSRRHRAFSMAKKEGGEPSEMRTVCENCEVFEIRDGYPFCPILNERLSEKLMRMVCHLKKGET